MSFFEETDKVLGGIWDTLTNKYVLLGAGGLTFAGICIASGGVVAGAASTYSFAVSASSSALITLSSGCQAIAPHLQAAGSSIAELALN
ncbi:MAG: hypothetical protein KAJ29_06450 [Alphaproteobacteria bacterium]|nr:hypothetical protein [Alphaproteobacteria bacterium]